MLSPKVDTKRLKQTIRWIPDDEVWFDPSGCWELRTMGLWAQIFHQDVPYSLPNSPPKLKRGDYERAAWCYLATAVNPYPGEIKHVHRRLCTPRLIFEQHHPTIRLGLQLVPNTLLATLWLQLAQAIDQGREYRKCLYCREAFIVGTGVEQNKKREYCKDACRVMHWREQRKLLKITSPPKRPRRKST